VELSAHVVILEVAVNSSDRVGVAPGQTPLTVCFGEINDPTFQTLGFFVVHDRQVEEAPVAVVTQRVVAGGRVVGKEVPIGYMAGGTIQVMETLLALKHL